MAGKFELRTRHQFAGIIEKRHRWEKLRNSPTARDRWDRFTGPYWARQNCALDEIANPSPWDSEVLDCSRTRELQCHMAAVQTLMRFSEEKDFLSPDDLLDVHRVMMSESHPFAGHFRRREAESLGEGHEPTDVELVHPIVENSLDWFQSDSFAEMHEVEKAALMLIKLIDIQPFDEGNGRTVRLFSSFFLLKAGYPPAIISPNRASLYAIAIQHSLRFHTQPIIDLIAEVIDQGLAYLLDEPATPPKFSILPS